MRNKPADIPYGGLSAERIQSASPKFDPKNRDYFIQFVIDRYSVHLKKDVIGDPKPWTTNPILLDFKFTNIRREHDRTTKHLLGLLEEHKDAPYGNKIMNIILYRLFNKIETSDLLGWVNFGKYDEDILRKRLRKAESGFNYFTNAFHTSGMRRQFRIKYPEEAFEPILFPRVCNELKSVVVKAIKKAKTPMEVIEALKQMEGIGNFLAYQMFVDFTYLDEFPWSENEFVVSGPGCMMGLDFLFMDKDGLTYDELMFWLRDNCPITPEMCDKLMIDLPKHDRYMNVMSLENCMCELSKYIRAAEGTGRPKNKYRGRC